MTKVLDFVKKNIVLCTCFVSFIILFVVMMSLGVFKKGTFSVEEEENRVIINCPSAFSAMETIECDISLSLVDNTTIYSLNANYDFADGITYESFGVDTTECTGESCFELFESTENGFAVINTDGISGNINVGRLRVKMPNNVTPNESYSIGLKEIEISYGENIEMLSLENSYITSRTKNNVATLSNLSITDININETFDSNIFDYSASVGSDISSININYELTDQNSIVSGSNGMVDLHYGTNIFNIVVTSEDSEVNNTYKLSVNREYEFNTDRYLYNKTENYIYTGTDSGNTIINNLELLNEDLSYNIKNNKLCIVYSNDEELLCVNIINFGINYTIINDKIYIDDNLTFNEFMSNVELGNYLNNSDFSLLDSNGELVTDSNSVINNNYRLVIESDYGITDNYTFTVEYLQINGSLMIDDEVMMIKRLHAGTTVGTLVDMFDTSGIVKVTSKGNIVSDNSYIKTGDILTITMTNTTITYTLSVLGDITGDGMIDIDDVGKLYRYFRGKEQLSGCYIAAGEITFDGMIDIDDVGRLYRYFRGKESSLEV